MNVRQTLEILKSSVVPDSAIACFFMLVAEILSLHLWLAIPILRHILRLWLIGHFHCFPILKKNNKLLRNYKINQTVVFALAF